MENIVKFTQEFVEKQMNEFLEEFLGALRSHFCLMELLAELIVKFPEGLRHKKRRNS